MDKEIKIGDSVYWHDPDYGKCSGRYVVESITGEIITLSNGDAVVEALAAELSICGG